MLETYAQVVLHPGCTNLGRVHKWSECPAQEFFLRIARKHQRKLQSNSLTIGYRVNLKNLITDLRQIKDQKGDYLGLLDSLIEDLEKFS